MTEFVRVWLALFSKGIGKLVRLVRFEIEPQQLPARRQRSREASEPIAAPAVSVVGPGDGETIFLGTTRLRVLEDGSNTGHRLGLAESVLAPHTPGPPQHRHAQHDEGFYIISGTVRFTVGDKDYDATAGTLITLRLGRPGRGSTASRSR